MDKKLLILARAPTGRFLLPALLLCVFLVYAGTAFTSTLYVDIAASFKVSIGTATMLSLTSAALGLVMGLVLSIVSLKFNHKKLFISGIALCATGTLIFFLAQNFDTAILAYFFLGIGAPLILIMNVT